MKNAKKNNQPDQMDQVRAARAILVNYDGEARRQAELEAFMAIFHPKKAKDRKFMHRIKSKE